MWVHPSIDLPRLGTNSSRKIQVGIAVDVAAASGSDVFASKGVIHVIKTAAVKNSNEDKVRSKLQIACCNNKIYSYEQTWQYDMIVADLSNGSWEEQLSVQTPPE